jgi:hypothetical protein
MHEFVIGREREDIDKTIIGLQGKVSDSNNWVMRKTCVRAKPNSQIAEWSPKLYLLTSVPDKDSMPSGTPKFHLFRKLTRENKMISQTPEELEKKLAELKKTVAYVSKLKQFDAEDKKWWEDFWSARSGTRDRLGNEEGDCEPDPLSVRLTKDFLWSVRIPLVPAAPSEDINSSTRETSSSACPLRDLATALTPRKTPATAVEFGRSRKVGYVSIGANDKQEDMLQNVVQAARKAVAVDSKETRIDFFKTLQLSRGMGSQGELKFAENLEVSQC